MTIILAAGCSPGGTSDSRAESARIADSIAAAARKANDLTSEAEAYADSILSDMSLEERAGMLFMPAAFAKSDEYNIRRIVRYATDFHVGGIVLLKGDLESASMIADTLRSLGGAGYFIAVDAENGLRMRFPDAPEFPWSHEMGKISDDQLLYDFGREIARECREVGINMVLGPVVDVVPGERSHGLMRKRSLGSDPKRVAELAVAYSRGVEDGNVISVAKHFPGHGSSKADSHKALGEIHSAREVMDSVDLYPFARYAQEHLSGVMVGHLSVAALDSLRRPAIVSPEIMGNILRRKLGFRGLVITDAINMEGAMGVKGWEAISAGADMVLAPSDTPEEIASLVEACQNGHLSEKVLNDRCRRILFYKYLVGASRRSASSDEPVRIRVGRGAPAVSDSISSALHIVRTPTYK